jgi:hypothetical protein
MRPLVVKALALLAAVTFLAAAAATPRAPLWSRSLPAGPPVFDVQLAMVGDVVLVRSGYAIVGLDAVSGKTRWTVPNATSVALAGSTLVVARNNTVFAVRTTDAGVVWSHPCAPAAFVIATTTRVATLCSGRIAILRVNDGETLASAPITRAATGRAYQTQPINANYFALGNDAELTTRFAVIDARTGAVRWIKENSQIVASGATWIDLTPAQARVVWAPAGTVERRSLATGKLLGTHRYQFSVVTDDHGTPLFESTAAVYAIAGNGELYRSPLNGTEMTRITPESGSVVAPTTLGASAFYGTMPNGTAPTATMYVDQPNQGGFKETALGAFDAVAGVRAGNEVAFKRGGTIVLFGSSGTQDATLQANCPTIGGIATSARRYVLLCTAKTTSTIVGFARS